MGPWSPLPRGEDPHVAARSQAVLELKDACHLNLANCRLKLEDWDAAAQVRVATASFAAWFPAAAPLAPLTPPALARAGVRRGA